MYPKKLDGRHKWKEFKRTKLSITWRCSACGAIFKEITKEQMYRILNSITKKYKKKMIQSLFRQNTLFKILAREPASTMRGGEGIIIPIIYKKQVTK